MTTPSLHRFAFIRRALAASLLSGGLLALGGSLHAQQTATFTNGGTPANTGVFNNTNSWSTGVIPTSTTTTSDTANFDGTGGGATAGTPLVLTDNATTDGGTAITVGGAGGNQGIILNLTSGQAGGLTLNASASVRLAAGASSTSAAPTTAVTMAAGSGPLSISSVLIGGTSAAATFTSFVNNSASTFSMANLQPGGGNTRTLNLLGTGNYAFTGAVQAASNTLNITKGVSTGNTDGTGTLTISAANTYTGVTTINTGIVSISNNTALGAAGTATNTGTAAAPTFTNTGDTVITSGTGSALNSGQLNLVGGTGSLNVAETFVFGGRSSVANGGTVILENVSGTNQLSGTLNFSTGGTDYGIKSDAGSLTLPNAIAPLGGSKIFDFYGAGAVIISGAISDTATGTTSITRPSGAGNTGTLTLSNANQYTGATTIAAGTLVLANTTGSATGTSAVAINSGGSLGGGNGAANSGALQTLGTGSMTATRQTYAAGVLGITTGTITVSGTGNVSPGAAAVGTLTVGALTLNTGTTLTYEFNGTANDFTVVTGALKLAGTSSLTLLQEGSTTAFGTAGIYNLFSYGTGSTITTGNLSVANPITGLTYTFVNDTTDSLVQLDITGTAVPEPSTWVGGLLGIGVGIMALRRRMTVA